MLALSLLFLWRTRPRRPRPRRRPRRIAYIGAQASSPCHLRPLSSLPISSSFPRVCGQFGAAKPQTNRERTRHTASTVPSHFEKYPGKMIRPLLRWRGLRTSFPSPSFSSPLPPLLFISLLFIQRAFFLFFITPPPPLSFRESKVGWSSVDRLYRTAGRPSTSSLLLFLSYLRISVSPTSNEMPPLHRERGKNRKSDGESNGRRIGK